MFLIGPFSQVVSLKNCPLKGALSDTMLLLYENSGIVIDENKKIQEIGVFDQLTKKYSCPIHEQNGREIVLPGFVDAHTHICFAGNRVHDYSLRQSGRTYLEIAHSGGGIWRTVADTRSASEDQLYELTLQRINSQLQQGITTTEIKSGYGIGVEQELRILRILKNLKNTAPSHIIPTCLAAHIPDLQTYTTAKNYLAAVVKDLFPQLKREDLTSRIDIFTEKSAFSIPDSTEYLMHAQRSGFDITIHADQFSYGAGEMGLKFGAKSIDHLEHTQDSLFPSLAASTTIAIGLPGASIGLGEPFMPIRRMLNAGISCAVASDWNPGSAPMGHLLTALSVMGTYEKLTIAEMLAAITYRAATALGLHDRGRLITGEWADFSIFPTTDFREVFYRQGQLSPSIVFRAGEQVIS